MPSYEYNPTLNGIGKPYERNKDVHIDLTKPIPGVKRDTYVTFVLDETDSMRGVAAATVNGFNEYLGTLKQNPELGEVQLSLIKFNSVTGPNKMYVGMNVRDIPPLINGVSYSPSGMTPLIDAVAEAILATDRVVAGRNVSVLFVIQTDGQENYSRQHSPQGLRAMIEARKHAGWTFVFLGADIDAFAGAAVFGISQNFAASYDKSFTADTFAVMGTKAQAFRATGGNAASASFNAGDRQTMDPNAGKGSV